MKNVAVSIGKAIHNAFKRETEPTATADRFASFPVW